MAGWSARYRTGPCGSPTIRRRSPVLPPVDVLHGQRLPGRVLEQPGVHGDPRVVEVGLAALEAGHLGVRPHPADGAVVMLHEVVAPLIGPDAAGRGGELELPGLVVGDQSAAANAERAVARGELGRHLADLELDRTAMAAAFDGHRAYSVMARRPPWNPRPATAVSAGDLSG